MSKPRHELLGSIHRSTAKKKPAQEPTKAPDLIDHYFALPQGHQPKPQSHGFERRGTIATSPSHEHESGLFEQPLQQFLPSDAIDIDLSFADDLFLLHPDPVEAKPATIQQHPVLSAPHTLPDFRLSALEKDNDLQIDQSLCPYSALSHSFAIRFLTSILRRELKFLKIPTGAQDMHLEKSPYLLDLELVKWTAQRCIRALFDFEPEDHEVYEFEEFSQQFLNLSSRSSNNNPANTATLRSLSLDKDLPFLSDITINPVFEDVELYSPERTTVKKELSDARKFVNLRNRIFDTISDQVFTQSNDYKIRYQQLQVAIELLDKISAENLEFVDSFTIRELIGKINDAFLTLYGDSEYTISLRNPDFSKLNDINAPILEKLFEIKSARATEDLTALWKQSKLPFNISTWAEADGFLKQHIFALILHKQFHARLSPEASQYRNIIISLQETLSKYSPRIEKALRDRAHIDENFSEAREFINNFQEGNIPIKQYDLLSILAKLISSIEICNEYEILRAKIIDPNMDISQINETYLDERNTLLQTLDISLRFDLFNGHNKSRAIEFLNRFYNGRIFITRDNFRSVHDSLVKACDLLDVSSEKKAEIFGKHAELKTKLFEYEESANTSSDFLAKITIQLKSLIQQNKKIPLAHLQTLKEKTIRHLGILYQNQINSLGYHLSSSTLANLYKAFVIERNNIFDLIDQCAT